MSASITTAARASVSDAARMPARSELFTPRAYSGLTTGRYRMPSSACCTRSASWPSTTISGSKPAFDARSTARRTSVSPASCMNSLFWPMRVEVPAASTTPATGPVRSHSMNRLPFFAQVAGRPARDHREQLADDADRDLLGSVGAEVQADRSEHAAAGGRAKLAEHLVGSRARPEQPDVRRAALQEHLQPVAIVSERMRLDHDQRASVDAERLDAAVGSEVQQPVRRWKALLRQECLPMIHDRYRKARLLCKRHEGTRIVARAADDQRGRRVEHLGENLPRAIYVNPRRGVSPVQTD